MKQDQGASLAFDRDVNLRAVGRFDQPDQPAISLAVEHAKGIHPVSLVLRVPPRSPAPRTHSGWNGCLEE